MGLSCKGVEGGYWRGIDGRKLGFFVDICKLFLIFKPPLENGVSIWSSRRGKVLVEGGRGRTVASPVDCQRRWGLLPWKQGLTGSSILHTSPTWTQQTNNQHMAEPTNIPGGNPMKSPPDNESSMAAGGRRSSWLEKPAIRGARGRAPALAWEKCHHRWR